MNAQDLATRLNGRPHPFNITDAEREEARHAGLVIVYGDSDDLMEFDGAIHDEVGAYNGTTARVTKSGLLQLWESFEGESDEAVVEAYFARKAAGFKTIEALWCAEPPISWTFATDIPHQSFEIHEDGEVFCRGIVFALADL